MTFKDPTCHIDHPAHICRRRDGQLLTGGNGDCWPNAQAESVNRPREHPTNCPMPGCDRMSWRFGRLCAHHARSMQELTGIGPGVDPPADTGHYEERCDVCGLRVVAEHPDAARYAAPAMDYHRRSHSDRHAVLDPLGGLSVRHAETMQVVA
jgi:hypothetical protein